MTDDIIRTVNISKEYGDVKAVSNMNLNVRKGEIYGFLGLNGAGKTTTIRMLLGMIRPSSGNAFINGVKISANKNELWKKIGYMIEIPYSYPNLTVRENIDLIRRLRFIDDKTSLDRIITQLGLSQYQNRKAKNLSLGNAQRLGLAKALIHQPEILILDEPTNGLDPAGIHEIRELLLDLAANKGVTVFVSSHILGEVSRFASRIGIIHQGKLKQEIDTNQLEFLCQKQIIIQSRDLEKAFSILNEKGFKTAKKTGDSIVLKDEKTLNRTDEIASILVNAGCPPTQLKIEEENLESYFLRTIKNEQEKVKS